MVREILGLAEQPVTAIMTPRDKVVWLDAGADRETLLRILKPSPHREFPVARGSPERIEGIARKEDLYALCLEGKPFDPRSVLREPLTVRDSATVLDALGSFKRTPAELALVLDARNRFCGLVTRTDLLEAIAGELPDPGEEPAPA